MQSHLCTSLFYTLTLLAAASCTEIHAEYEAVHQTHLVRRSRPMAEFAQEQRRSLMRSKTVAERDFDLVNSTFMASTPLQDFKTEYIGSIGVGTLAGGNAQFNARVVFDTGSTNLWVASNLCKTHPCNDAKAKLFYDPHKSITQEEFIHTNNKTGDIDCHFGSGELIGPLHTDHFHVGPLVVKKQPFAMIRKMNGYVFESFPFEGILGLGFKSMSFAGIDPFFDHVIAQKLLTNNEFAFFMNVDSTKPSSLLWGGIDKDLYHGPIRMFPVTDAHYWSLDLLDFKVGNTSLLDSDPKKRVKHLVVDSGTTYFTAPSGLHSKISQALSSEDCTNVKNHPDLTYVLRGTDGKAYDLVVSQETYMIGDHTNYCNAAFWPLNVNNKHGPAMLLGEVFMRHFFTVFHRGDGKDSSAKVGFAPANTTAIPKVMNPTPASFLDNQSSKSAIRVDARATMASLGQSHRDVQPHKRP